MGERENGRAPATQASSASVGEENVQADGDSNKRGNYDVSELFCAPQVRCTWNTFS